MRRASASKSASSPVVNSQWSYTGRVTVRLPRRPRRLVGVARVDRVVREPARRAGRRRTRARPRRAARCSAPACAGTAAGRDRGAGRCRRRRAGRGPTPSSRRGRAAGRRRHVSRGGSRRRTSTSAGDDDQHDPRPQPFGRPARAGEKRHGRSVAASSIAAMVTASTPVAPGDGERPTTCAGLRCRRSTRGRAPRAPRWRRRTSGRCRCGASSYVTVDACLHRGRGGGGAGAAGSVSAASTEPSAAPVAGWTYETEAQRGHASSHASRTRHRRAAARQRADRVERLQCSGGTARRRARRRRRRRRGRARRPTRGSASTRVALRRRPRAVDRGGRGRRRAAMAARRRRRPAGGGSARRSRADVGRQHDRLPVQLRRCGPCRRYAGRAEAGARVVLLNDVPAICCSAVSVRNVPSAKRS